MKIHDCIQGTPEWLALRAGIPTASEFDKIITPGGKPSKSAEPYMYRLLAERCMRHPVAEFVSLWMQRGSESEIDAIRFYELTTDRDTVPVGFITNDEETWGASPDRLVGDDGALEIKVPSEYIHMQYLLSAGGAYHAYKVQVQAQLWITGRLWVDVMSWHRELPPALIRIERDEAFIGKMEPLVKAFSSELEKLYQVVRNRGWVKSEEQKTTNELEASIQILKGVLSRSAASTRDKAESNFGEGETASAADYTA